MNETFHTGYLSIYPDDVPITLPNCSCRAAKTCGFFIMLWTILSSTENNKKSEVLATLDKT
jgi:hypothetical protein